MRSSKHFWEDKDEEDIQIRVAVGQPLTTESLVLRTFSSCAKALPADAAVWDVSGLLYDGQPFSRETVSCWLSCAQRLVEGCAEPDAQDKQQLSTVTGLTEVLAFADAVGSRSSLCKALCSQVPQLQFVVQLPQQVLELPVAGYYCSFSHCQNLQLMQNSLQLEAPRPIGVPLASYQQRLDVQQQVASQLSALLRLAHVLGVSLLLDTLHSFIILHVGPKRGKFSWSYAHWQWESLLSDVVGLVFNDAVLEAALASSGSTLSKEAYVSSVLSQPCSLKAGAIDHSSLLTPVPGTSHLVGFEAQLRRDFAGARAGDRVKVMLDLFGGEFIQLFNPNFIGTDHVTLPAQLLLGHSFSTAAALDEYLAASPE